MIRTIDTKYIDKAIELGYKVALIDKNSKHKERINGETILDFLELSPSILLEDKVKQLKNINMWDEHTFKTEYAEQYLKELIKKPHIGALNELFARSRRGEKIALASEGNNANMSHRSIVLGLLQAVGVETEGDNYSPYWLLYRIFEQEEKRKCQKN